MTRPYPKYRPRRPYYDDQPDGYLESDRDYLENNNDLAVRLLDERGARLKAEKEKKRRARAANRRRPGPAG